MTTYAIDPGDWESATGESVDTECVLVRRVPDELRERLAEAAHDSWTGWMDYLFSKSTMNPDGSVTIPMELVGRWMIQMQTAYWNLPEDQKVSDRAEADKILDRITAT